MGIGRHVARAWIFVGGGGGRLQTYNVTPAAHMSALKPDHESCPSAISGGWKAGLP